MNFSSHEAFAAMDSDGDQNIDKEDLRQFFSRHCMYVPDKELCGLIERYDKNRDGKISYTEFAQEITPRCLL
jgi:Ca2+-binding EF-hand superfamily protein